MCLLYWEASSYLYRNLDRSHNSAHKLRKSDKFVIEQKEDIKAITFRV